MFSNRYLIQIEGKDPKRFVRSLMKMHLNLLRINQIGNNYQVLVNSNTYQQIKAIKTIYKITIIKTSGLIFIKEQFLKKKIFFITLFLGFMLLVYLSNIIFDIEIVHSNTEIRSLIADELEAHGIRKNSLAIGFNKRESIIESILEAHKDTLEWMEIDRVGTKYIVKVEERKLSLPIEEYNFQDVIAKKDGIIKEITALSGEIIVSNNSYVKKGDLLISGQIKQKDEVKTLVKADGVVLAETWYKATVSLPLSYHEEKLTGRNKHVLSITFLNNSYSLFDFSPYKDKRIKENILLFNKSIPLYFSYNLEEELNIIDKIYTADKAIIKARELAADKIKASLGVKDRIISQKDLKIVEEECKITIEVFFKVLEDITAYIPINIPKIGQKTE